MKLSTIGGSTPRSALQSLRDMFFPVLAAIQGYPKSPRLWEKYADKIIRDLGLIPTVHEPCLYSGLTEGERVFFKHQVKDFETATTSEHIANILFNKIDNLMTSSLERQDWPAWLMTLTSFRQNITSRSRFKPTSNEFWKKKLNYLMKISQTQTSEYPAPLPHQPQMMHDILNAEGSSDEKIQENLRKKMGFGYCNMA